MNEVDNCELGDPISEKRTLLSPLADVFLSKRLRPLLIVSIYSFLMFPLFRVGVFLFSREAVQHTTVWEIGVCFAYGFQFDAIVVGYALLPMVLTLGLVPARYLANRVYRRVVTIYATVIMSLVFVLEVVNAVFMVNFRRRLNWATLNYPRHPRETAIFIWKTYNLWLIILLPATAAAVYFLYRLLRRYCWMGRLTFNSRRKRLAFTGVTVALCVLACRPALGRYPLRPGSEIHSSNNLVNQASTNTFFSLYHAVVRVIKDGDDEDKYYGLPSLPDACRTARALLFQDGDESVGTYERPLRRRVKTGRRMLDRNVVVIIMEGQANEPVGALGHGGIHTPELDRICADGLFLDRLYATGARTSR